VSSFRKNKKDSIKLEIDGICLTAMFSGRGFSYILYKSVCNNHCMHDFSTNFWSSDSLPIASVSDSGVLKAKRRSHQNLLGLMTLLYLLWRVVLVF